MAVAVSSIGELERYVAVAGFGPVVTGPRVEQLSGELGSDQPGEELAQDHVLVVPARGPPRLLEQILLTDAVLPQSVDEPIVQPQEGDLDLAHEQVNVIARVAEQRDPFL